MRLRVWLPAEILFEEKVSRIRAEAENGWFGLLPKHIDFVTALVPGVLTFEPVGKPEEYLAVVSTRQAVRGTSLDHLKQEVERQFRTQQEREKAARALEAKLEADLVRRLLEVEKHG
jgi:F-type H+-transporting ATPase subunit epsilon